MKIILTLLLALTTTIVKAQPAYNMSRIQTEKLSRGLVCIRQSDSIIISWRLLSSDTPSTSFNIYADGSKLNSIPITSTTFCKVKSMGSKAIRFRVATVDNGSESGRQDGTYTLPAQSADPYLTIPLRTPPSGVTPDGRSYSYTANDASVGDIDGDGQVSYQDITLIKGNVSGAGPIGDDTDEFFAGDMDCDGQLTMQDAIILKSLISTAQRYDQAGRKII